MSADILARLDGVRETGPGRWLARCPAHDDRSPSLSVRMIDGDRWLVHCFAGCDPLDVVHAIGLELSDLFEGSSTYTTPHGPHVRRIPAADVLAALDHEITTAAVIIADVAEHREIDEPTWARLAQAVSRIGSARAACCPAKTSRRRETSEAA